MLIVAAVSCQVKSQPTMLPPSSVRWDGITRCRARRFFYLLQLQAEWREVIIGNLVLRWHPRRQRRPFFVPKNVWCHGFERIARRQVLDLMVSEMKMIEWLASRPESGGCSSHHFFLEVCDLGGLSHGIPGLVQKDGLSNHWNVEERANPPADSAWMGCKECTYIQIFFVRRPKPSQKGKFKLGGPDM